jgi:hypothetical protein
MLQSDIPSAACMVTHVYACGAVPCIRYCGVCFGIFRAQQSRIPTRDQLIHSLRSTSEETVEFEPPTTFRRTSSEVRSSALPTALPDLPEVIWSCMYCCMQMILWYWLKVQQNYKMHWTLCIYIASHGTCKSTLPRLKLLFSLKPRSKTLLGCWWWFSIPWCNF